MTSQSEQPPIIDQLESDGRRTITLNRPHKLNAMNPELIEAVAKSFEAANADDETRVILFSGAGRAFCAGDDREAHRHPENRAEAEAMVEAIQRVSRAMLFGSKPIVGAINGWAVGGGFEWALNCDFPIWAESARGFFPEVSLNLFVTGGVTALLPAIVGMQKAREMLFLGQHYEAEELSRLGVAWRVVPDQQLMEESRQLAQQLAALPVKSVQAMKSTLNRVGLVDLERALAAETEATIAGFLDPETTRRLKDF